MNISCILSPLYQSTLRSPERARRRYHRHGQRHQQPFLHQPQPSPASVSISSSVLSRSRMRTKEKKCILFLSKKVLKGPEKYKSPVRKTQKLAVCGNEVFSVRTAKHVHLQSQDIPGSQIQTWPLRGGFALRGEPWMSSSETRGPGSDPARNSQTTAQPAGELRLQGGLLASYLGL